MKLQNPLAQVVWYGSLSRSGKRKSFVRLDEASTDFFKNVDAFYADYGWVPDDAKFSAAFELDRRYDVFMGIDVFGRHNMLGGGKMNCGEPLCLAWNSGVSAALFAPGWTHECCQHEEQEDFVVVESRFWGAVRDSWKVKSPCYDALGGKNCLYSAFNIGRGVGVWAEGRRVGSGTWSNMTELDVQTTQALHAGSTVTTATGSMKAAICHDMAFQGGSSVQLQVRSEVRHAINRALGCHCLRYYILHAVCRVNWWGGRSHTSSSSTLTSSSRRVVSWSFRTLLRHARNPSAC